jgi:hypothetical protein
MQMPAQLDGKPQVLLKLNDGSGLVLAKRVFDNGHRDLIAYRPDDGPSARNVLHLDEDDAVALAKRILRW